MRILKTIGLLMASYAIVFFITFLMFLLNPSISEDSATGIGFIAMLAFWSFLATKVNYRWFDCFFALIPFYGAYWVVKIMYRVAGLQKVKQ